MQIDQSSNKRSGESARLKREIVAISTLPTYPGYWLLEGRTEGEDGSWFVVRAPKGRYSTAVMPMHSESEPRRVELGDRITDAVAIAQFEAGFNKLRHTPE